MKTNTYSIEEKIEALAKFLNCETDEISQESYDNYDMSVFSVNGEEYAVASDGEADEAWDQLLDNYIEECIQPELDKIPGNLGNYFDHEGWKADARMDGRGHSLSPYDGNEEESDGYFIYRLN